MIKRFLAVAALALVVGCATHHPSKHISVLDKQNHVFVCNAIQWTNNNTELLCNTKKDKWVAVHGVVYMREF